jgi:hypothetical protein
LDLGVWNNVASAVFHVPPSTPYDMYDLSLSFAAKSGEWMMASGQAVCVREPLPQEFHVAGCGHMNTWGQQTSEYLARVAQVAELGGARTLLISNEVNAAYVSGSLRPLRIPYLVTRGNHTMPRWDEFYGVSSTAHDDGELRIVTFGRWPYESWREAARLIQGRADAANRILLCYEAYAPIDLIRQGQVDLLFDGHSDSKHPDRDAFPPGTLQMRAPNQESLRWIPMTREGLAADVRSAEDVPVLNVPRSGPAPLRAEFSEPNDGGVGQQTAVITNEYPIQFPRVRVRFILRPGRYRLEGGTLVQTFHSDNGGRTIVDAEVEVNAKETVAVAVRPE